MSRWRDDPQGSADHLIVESLPDIDLPAAAEILSFDGGPRLSAALATWPATHVRRRLRPGEAAASFEWPVAAPAFAGGLLRLPKDKRELIMTAHLIAARLEAGAPLIVYGGNDEGIRSAAKSLEALGTAETAAAHSHGRVLSLRVDARPGRGDVLDWRETQTIGLSPDVQRSWVSYPGVFAGGGIDAGTALLLAHLPKVQAGARVLDFACGTGVIGGALLARTPRIALTGIDNDALALAAASENVAGAAWHWGTSLAAVAGQSFDLIVSNPPFHDGVREDGSIISTLIAAAPRHLTPNGHLCLVTQRRFALGPLLSAQFKTVTIAADDNQYRVWQAAAPLKPQRVRR